MKNIKNHFIKNKNTTQPYKIEIYIKNAKYCINIKGL